LFIAHASTTNSTLSLHDALPIWLGHLGVQYAAKMGFHTVGIARGQDKEALACQLGAAAYINSQAQDPAAELQKLGGAVAILATRSEEHTSELQSRFDLVCRLLLE